MVKMIGFFGDKLEKDLFLMSFFLQLMFLMLNKFIIIYCKRVDNKL